MGMGKVSKQKLISPAMRRRRKHKRQVREAGARVLEERRAEFLVSNMGEVLERM